VSRAERSNDAVELPAPLLGEWACLGVLYDDPAHGWAVAARLGPDGDLGRVWHVSRPLTYRALDQLAARGWVGAVAVEPGAGGPRRTVLRATRSGRAQLRSWVRSPVPHLRDLRSELLLKLVLADLHDLDVGGMLDEQRGLVDRTIAGLDVSGRPDDLVREWRWEMAHAARRFLDGIDR